MEFNDKRLRVQRKSQDIKDDAPQNINQVTNQVKEEEKWDIPLFAINPGCVVVFMNMMAPSDVYDQEEVEKVQHDLVEQCETFGKVEKVHVPRPILLTET